MSPILLCCLVDLRRGEYARCGWDSAGGQSAGVAAAVHPLVEHARDGTDLGELRLPPENPLGEVRDCPHSLPLDRSERAFPVPDAPGDADDAEAADQASLLDQHH